ncbi:MAG: hypothetical protein KBA51_05500 [Kiritimatiellae bacterium]|nr:hypothetical protein [Kiritimatiellia bacterium]
MSFVSPEPGLPERPDADEPRPGSGVARAIESWIGWCIALIVILAMLYGGLLLAARTEGFRALLAQRMERRTGISVRIGHSTLSPGLTLTLRDIRWPNDTAPAQPADDGDEDAEVVRPEGSVDEMRIRFRFPRLRWRSLELRGARWTLYRSEDGEWAPAALAARLAGADRAWGLRLFPNDLEGLAPPADAVIAAEDLTMTWYRDAEHPACVVEGLTLHATPCHSPSRDFLHVRMQARLVQSEGAATPGPRAEEWIIYEGGRVQIEPSPPPREAPGGMDAAVAPEDRGELFPES